MTYPVEYYYPEFIESRTDDPRISTPPRPPLTNGVSTSRNFDPLITNRKDRASQLGTDIAAKQGRVDDDITQTIKTDLRTSLLRDPAEKSTAKVNINRDTFPEARVKPTIPVTNLDDSEEDLPPILDLVPSRETNRTRGLTNNQWPKSLMANPEPRTSQRETFFGPYGISRTWSAVYYIALATLALLAAIFLIMTGVFYSQKYPDASNDTAKIIGMAVCGAVFYFSIILILVGIWHQLYRYENSLKPVVKREIKPPTPIFPPEMNTTVPPVRSDAYLEDLDTTKEHPDYAPAQFTIVNEKVLLQQPGAATGAGSYDGVVWPSNVEIDTKEEKSATPIPRRLHTPLDTNILASKLAAKTDHGPEKTVVAQLPRVEFDNIQLKTTVDDEPEVPTLTKAPDTSDLIKAIADMERQHQRRSPVSGDLSAQKSFRVALSSLSGDQSPKKSSRPAANDNKSTVSMPEDSGSDEHRHRHRHRHRHHHSHSHHRHHHHSHSRHRRHHHDHHHHHHHRHRHHSHSPPPDHYHHHPHVVHLPSIVTPHYPKVITPTPMKTTNTSIYRDTGINTNTETKIMKDSSVAADFEEQEGPTENRLDKIPVVRRTIIVEPYPAEPTSKIVVKPRSDMIGKIRLGKNLGFTGENGEAIIYPTTSFVRKRSKSKKKGTMVNNQLIEDLKLDDLDNRSKKKKSTTRSLPRIPVEKVAIRNAFYN